MVNNVVIVGRVVRDPELIETSEGRKVTSVTLAVARSFKNAQTGEYDTDFISVSFWEGIAKSVVEYCHKGSVIGVKGRLVHRTYDIPNYKVIRCVEVVAEKVSFIQTKHRQTEGSSELTLEKEMIRKEA